MILSARQLVRRTGIVYAQLLEIWFPLGFFSFLFSPSRLLSFFQNPIQEIIINKLAWCVLIQMSVQTEVSDDGDFPRVHNFYAGRSWKGILREHCCLHGYRITHLISLLTRDQNKRTYRKKDTYQTLYYALYVLSPHLRTAEDSLIRSDGRCSSGLRVDMSNRHVSPNYLIHKLIYLKISIKSDPPALVS